MSATATCHYSSARFASTRCGLKGLEGLRSSLPLQPAGAKHAGIVETTGRSGGHLQPPVLRKGQLPVVAAEGREAWTTGRQC